MNVEDYKSDVMREFARLRALADGALSQVDDAAFFEAGDGGGNALAVLVKHLAGNMRSRWTDFLTTDGEKPDRNRDTEFVIDARDTRARLMERWKEGWTTLHEAIGPLTESDFDRRVAIRGEGHSVLQAIQRQLSHYAYHVGQIVQRAKAMTGPAWSPLSIPPGQSARFNLEPEAYLDEGGA